MKNLLFPAAFLLLFSACKKTNPSVNDYLHGTWKQTAGTLRYFIPNNSQDFLSMDGRDTTINYFENADPCYKDDLLTFKNEEVGYAYYGTVACNNTEPTGESFNWYTNSAVRENGALTITDLKRDTQGPNLAKGGKFTEVLSNTFTIQYIEERYDLGPRSVVAYYTNTYTRQ